MEDTTVTVPSVRTSGSAASQSAKGVRGATELSVLQVPVHPGACAAESQGTRCLFRHCAQLSAQSCSPFPQVCHSENVLSVQ